MPRKAKEKVVENEIVDEKEKKSVTKKSTAKKTTTANKSATKKTTTAAKKTTTKKTTTAAKKSTTKKASTSKTTTKKEEAVKETEVVEKKTAPKKTTTKKQTTATPKEKTSTKKAAAKKTTTKKATTTRKTRTTKKTSDDAVTDINIIEYYDLPYKYGNTIVKLLAQTPKTLFVFWEISDEDITNFKKAYGEDFFNKTKPILIVHNITLNKTTEVEINDFANCWYLNTETADCVYNIELARVFINNNVQNKNNNLEYLHIATSNTLEAPNDHIMFEKLTDEVAFRNVKTNEIIEKKISSFEFLSDIFEFYKKMYNDELLKNPSSKF